MTLGKKKILAYDLKDIEWENTEKYLEKIFNEVKMWYSLNLLTMYEALDLKLKAIDLLIKLDQWKAQNKWY